MTGLVTSIEMLPIRTLRPFLSTPYQCIRCASTIIPPYVDTSDPQPPSNTTQQQQQQQQPPPSPKSSALKGNRGRLIWTVSALGVGWICGNFINHTLAPPALPDAGTHGDQVLMADLNKRIDNDFKVKVLRGKCLGVAKQLKGRQGGWVELIQEEDTTGLRSSLAGAKALGVERLFWNRDEEKLIAVVWFGGSVSGWPGVTHGGIIATQVIEKVGILEALMHGASRSVSASAVPQRLPGTGDHAKMPLSVTNLQEPEELSLSYVKPTYANGFYVVRVSPALPLDTDPPHVVPGEPASGRHDYEATLETMDARILVKAKASMSTGTQLAKIEQKAEEAVKWTADQFRQWMWPSRQNGIHA